MWQYELDVFFRDFYTPLAEITNVRLVSSILQFPEVTATYISDQFLSETNQCLVVLDLKSVTEDLYFNKHIPNKF